MNFKISNNLIAFKYLHVNGLERDACFIYCWLQSTFVFWGINMIPTNNLIELSDPLILIRVVTRNFGVGQWDKISNCEEREGVDTWSPRGSDTTLELINKQQQILAFACIFCMTSNSRISPFATESYGSSSGDSNNIIARGNTQL